MGHDNAVEADRIEIEYDAPQSVRDALERLGRIEDVRFSPDNRRLALAAFDRNSIAIVGVDVTTDGARPRVAVRSVTELSSPRLNRPHGIDFLDDETIIVANRGADVAVFRLPSADEAVDCVELTAIDPPSTCGFEQLAAPGSLVVVEGDDGRVEVLVCNNDGNTLTRHVLDAGLPAEGSSDVLLRRWLHTPDGVAVSADSRWLAVSNHVAHCVMLYERSPALDESSDPHGILRGVSWPHGLRFTADARHLLVADAGWPYVHVYARDGGTWSGVRHPTASVRVMDDETFRLGRQDNAQEGGPKGIDIDRRGHVLAVTYARRPLAFCDVSRILERASARCADPVLQVGYELEIFEQARTAEARIAGLEGSTSFRVTAPLRRLAAAWAKRLR